MVVLSGSVDALEFSDKNSLLVATSQLTGRIWNGEIHVLDFTDDWKISKTFPSGGGITSVAWLGKNSEVFACAGDDGTIAIWSLVHNMKKDKLQPLRLLAEHDDVISALSINKEDNETMLSASWDLR
jgi:WD40 repeat protein